MLSSLLWWLMYFSAATFLCDAHAQSVSIGLPEDGQLPLRFLLVGDSLVAAPPKRPQDRCGGGWGSAFLSHLVKPSFGINWGLCGRTTVTYREGEAWGHILALLQSEDAFAYQTFVMISLGANDQKYNVSQEDTTANLVAYVDEVREAQAIPILVTPLSRTNTKPDGHVTRTLLMERRANIDAATQTGATLLDLNTASRQKFEQVGYEETLSYRQTPGSGTHLNERGAEVIGDVVCNLVVAALPEIEDSLSC